MVEAREEIRESPHEMAWEGYETRGIEETGVCYVTLYHESHMMFSSTLRCVCILMLPCLINRYKKPPLGIDNAYICPTALITVHSLPVRDILSASIAQLEVLFTL